MAPTKPLVAQQIEACHQLCGIPGRDAAELTGNVQKTKRMMAVRSYKFALSTDDLVSSHCSGRRNECFT